MNVFFDLENGVYTDLIVQKEHEKNEHKALCQMVNHSSIFRKIILPTDRNYEACNDLAHLERKGWNYLIHIRDKTGRWLTALNCLTGPVSISLSTSHWAD